MKEELVKTKGPALKNIDSELQDRKKVIMKRIDIQKVVNQEISSEITKLELAILKLEAVPAEQKKMTYLPTLKKQLKE